jgi:hypothetical protein
VFERTQPNAVEVETSDIEKGKFSTCTILNEVFELLCWSETADGLADKLAAL